ncbi:MAG: DNA adenine methylase [Chthoniobacterales bacterium]|nr:DNA adenine methylase [Chthoniobacterales bacterium]
MKISQQLELIEDFSPRSRIVNVSSVPQRSPFRYPGGKTWLVPRIREWLQSLSWRPALFVEPFAGGAIASLTVAFEKLAEEVYMSELDAGVAAVWKTIFSRTGASWLARRIASYELDRVKCEEDLARRPTSVRELAFLTILRNRVSRGGIMAPGAGIIDYGEAGRGVHSRWYPQTLRKRIEAIWFHRKQITFEQRDAFEVLREFSHRADAAFFIDPPYTASQKRAGARLYKHFEVDHRTLFEIAARCKGDVLLTYDNAEEIVTLSKEFGFQTHPVSMKNNHHAEMKELLIGKNLSWCRASA